VNYYRARQRKDGKWDYTCRNDGRIWPVGYCAEYNEDFSNLGMGEVYQDWFAEDYKRKYAPTQDKHHTCGHDTAEEACECYKQFLLDHNLRLKIQSSDTQRKCEVCGEWTQLYAELDCQMWNLCEVHNTREVVESLFEVFEICSSW
jgi:hypothetical protein